MKQTWTIDDVAEADRIWAAGAFDGEGYVGLSKVKGGYLNLRVAVCNTDPRFVAPFKAWFGGCICWVDASKYNPNSRPRWTWEITGGRGAGVMAFLRPFLRIKHEQADLAIEYARTLCQGRTPTPEVVARRAEIDALLRAEKTRIHA